MKKHVNYETPNKKVIRNKHKKGEFTTINLKLLRDKRLTSNAKVLIIHILSDSDDYRYSEKLYINRLNRSKTTYYRALENLIDNGYIRKENIDNTIFNYYIISEFGNLKKKDEMDESNENLDLTKKEIEAKTKIFLQPYYFFIKDNHDILSQFLNMLENGHDYYQIKSSLTKSLGEIQGKLFNDTSNIIKNNFVDKDIIHEAHNILKDEVYHKKIIPNYNNIIQKAQQNLKDKLSDDQESVEVDDLNAVLD